MRHSLLIVLIGQFVSPAALAQTDTQPLPACALREPDGPRPRGLGTIVGIQDAAVARAHVPLREAQRGGAIDPRYLNDLRAVVQQDNGIVDVFDVSAGMTVHVGDRVKLQGSYRSTASTCSYIPHMIVPNDVPIA
jgi:hypothetical protein